VGAQPPTNAPEPPVMDKKTKDFLTAMGKIKTGLHEKTGNDAIYYNTLGAAGYQHANEITDAEIMKALYKELDTKLKDLSGGNANA
jgi:hypothetical protein